MTKKKMITISFIIALIFGFPFKWIQYKGEQITFPNDTFWNYYFLVNVF